MIPQTNTQIWMFMIHQSLRTSSQKEIWNKGWTDQTVDGLLMVLEELKRGLNRSRAVANRAEVDISEQTRCPVLKGSSDDQCQATNANTQKR